MTLPTATTPTLKEILNQSNQDSQTDFENDVDISFILKKRSQTIDELLQGMWKQAGLDESLAASLVAVGGYGREEMHPASDVDLLILLADEPDTKAQEQLSNFVTVLWDLGLEIGHSVRTLDECVDEANNDLTVITNLIESRYLCGDQALFEQLQTKISPNKIWNSADFFEAKIEEQNNRYKRFGDTAYRVEPNLKEGPGGLRDLQTIGWIFLREYGVKSLKKLSTTKEVHLLNPDEYQALIEARDFLWRVRFALHQITGRKTDRLLFDHQRELAHRFGFMNDENNESIESFMQLYYRNITELERLNEVLLGLLREHILDTKQTAPIPINNYYNNNSGYLGLEQDDLFATQPHTLLEVFHIMQTRPEIKGLTPDTLRNLRHNLHLIDDDFRDNEHHKQIFINIMSESKGITFALRRMNRYGVLAAYIPAFANIVGRMQYDLFHAYTVDDHTLNVIRNVRRLSTEKGKEELPFCAGIFKTLHKPILLYLGGLFHDIAKGRGGSHSEKGAVDALEFCQSHSLNAHDAKTVSWLVEQHLLLSSVAQRKDLTDPEVIKEVADVVLTQERLDYLYLLTICDIRGTNPTLLNSWKHSLLKDLYRATRAYLQNGSLNIENTKQLIQQKKDAAQAQLNKKGFSNEVCQAFWNRFDTHYILQHSVEVLTWHISEITQNHDAEFIVKIYRDKTKNSSLLFIFAPDQADIFIRITAAIEQRKLDVVAARITSSNDGYVLDTFNLLAGDGLPLKDDTDKEQLISSIKKKLMQDDLSYDFNQHHQPRQLKYFDTPTKVLFDQDESRHQTIISIRTADRVGLLTSIGNVFNQQGLAIHDARISTLGEIAEDIFRVTTKGGNIIDSEEKQAQIRAAIEEKLQA
ncbi:MAG: [protein-PII] uridylyltransferase [Cocleimonas sp.]|nr:[protein-PII] uridylyltransferase [Cocleimonas sp.]